MEKSIGKIFIRKSRTFATLYLSLNANKSIYFFTLHKSASTVFSKLVLPNFKGLLHKDYANFVYNKPESYNRRFKFKRNGFVYGPIRVSCFPGIEKRLVVDPTIEPRFLKDKKVIIFIRDPREILISEYYSFGFNHVLNPVKEKREWQLNQKKKIQSQTIDEYALDNIEHQIESFNILSNIKQHSSSCTVIKYEEMILDFPFFKEKLLSSVDIDEDILKSLYEQTRPNEVVDQNAHKRSGAIDSYRKELAPETITQLNQRFEKILLEFDY